MREVTDKELTTIAGGRYSHTQCVSGITGAGGTTGAMLGGLPGFGLGVAVGKIVGEGLCNALNDGNPN